MSISQKILTITALITVLLFVVCGFASAKDLEVDYPDIGGVDKPTGIETSLTDYIRYIFALSIRIAGFIALGVMIYGGIRYLVSGGSAGKMADAKNQILGGFVGIIILLSSYLILKTINPEIVSTTITKEPTCVCDDCEFDQSQGKITNCGSEDCDCGRCEEYCTKELDNYKHPGIYLIGASEEAERVHLSMSKKELTTLTNEVTKETIDLNNKVKEIRFGRNNTEVIYRYNEEQEPDRYCAILHERENFQGPSIVFCEPTNEKPKGVLANDGTTGGIINGVSSITVFKIDPNSRGEVTIFKKQQGLLETSGDSRTFTFETNTKSLAPPEYLVSGFNEGTYSIKVNGNFLVLLCGQDSQEVKATGGPTLQMACLALTRNNEDLTQTPMGQCNAEFLIEEYPLFSWPASCVLSIAIYKIKPISYPQ